MTGGDGFPGTPGRDGPPGPRGDPGYKGPDGDIGEPVSNMYSQQLLENLKHS